MRLIKALMMVGSAAFVFQGGCTIAGSPAPFTSINGLSILPNQWGTIVDPICELLPFLPFC